MAGTLQTGGRSIKPGLVNKQMDIIMRNLNRAILSIENTSMAGLIAAAAYIRVETEKRPPLTPVDLGNLRASWFVVASKKGVQDGKVAKFKNRPGREGKKANLSGRMSRDHSIAIVAARATAATSPMMVVMGYSAYYALFIHESEGMHFQRPGAGPKWFQAAINNNRNQIFYIVGKYAKIEGHTPKFKI
jgi:hypothetical protein